MQKHSILQSILLEETMTETVTEKKIITEILQLYQELPCLWDYNHALYTNREAKTRAYEIILEKYKMLNPEANIGMVKKKIENMRTCYRRERKKVINELLKHGEERKPSLWYYEHLKFLDGSMESYEILEEDQESNDNVIPPAETNFVDNHSVFLKEDNDALEEDMGHSYVIKNQAIASRTENMTEAEAFGRTIGLQLNELTPVQRYIAEKLISDVIYYGRFEKLDMTSRLSNV